MRVLIDTQREGTIDVSKDLVRGSVTRITDGVSSFSAVLANHRRKYDRVFTPNDRITVAMKRIAWVQVFAGYLDEVPLLTVYAAGVPLKASCTLKRLQYYFWDPGAPESWELLHSPGDEGANGQISNQQEVDGGMKKKAIRLIHEVAGWEKETIHIGEVPSTWFEKARPLAEQAYERSALERTLVGTGPTIGGTGTGVGSEIGGGLMSLPSIGPGTGALPDNRGKISWFGGPGQRTATGPMNLTFEPGLNPTDSWYAAMRWPYSAPNTDDAGRAPGMTKAEFVAAREWWKNRRILVTNSKTNKQVVLRAADWGPAKWTGRVIDVSKHAMTVLGAGTDDEVTIAFAPEGAPLGEVTSTYTSPEDQSGGDSWARNNPNMDPRVRSGEMVMGASGASWNVSGPAGGAGLKPNTKAAANFIQEAFKPPFGIGGVGSRKGKSDHPAGLALDCMVAQEAMPTPENQAIGNAIAQWFVSNPNAFGTKYVIWYKKINEGYGWKDYTRYGPNPGPTFGHYDHPHISFHNTGQRALGTLGNPWPGADMSGFSGDFAAGIGPGGLYEGGLGANLFNAHDWTGKGGFGVESSLLSGNRALLNDQPILPTIRALMGACMRSFCSAPNGDFIAWFPDYFGQYGTSGKMILRDIEIQMFPGLSISWGDRNLRTHQFVAGANVGQAQHGALPGGAVAAYRKFVTHGIASIEQPEIMDALFNLPEGSPWRDTEAVLQRFGARPDFQSVGFIAGDLAEFWMALHLFQLNWAEQFSTNFTTTFMPEVYPGMLLVLEEHSLQVYVKAVTHNFDFEAGGFTTSIDVMAPSATDGSGLAGLPHAGPLKHNLEIGPPKATDGWERRLREAQG